MKIIITIKPTAILNRVEELAETLEEMKDMDPKFDLTEAPYDYPELCGFADVIESVTGDKQ